MAAGAVHASRTCFSWNYFRFFGIWLCCSLVPIFTSSPINWCLFRYFKRVVSKISEKPEHSTDFNYLCRLLLFFHPKHQTFFVETKSIYSFFFYLLKSVTTIVYDVHVTEYRTCEGFEGKFHRIYEFKFWLLFDKEYWPVINTSSIFIVSKIGKVNNR